MIAAQRLALILCAWIMAGCGQPRWFGVTCDEDGCAPRPARFRTCMERELTSKYVDPGGEFANFCHLMTLDELITPVDGEHAYLSAARAEGMPLGHDLDMRMAPAADLMKFSDGRKEDEECREILAAPVAWMPLIVTADETDNWSYEAAPLIARRGDRLLVIDAFRNMNPSMTIETRVTVRLSCAVERPALVTRPVRLGGPRISGVLQPPQTLPLRSTCTFLEPASIARLYRRDRVTSSFTVQTPGAAPLWQSADNNWSHDLAQPLDFDAGDELSWSCQLFNDTDTPFLIPSEEQDACMLFGFVRVPDGADAPALEGCDPVPIRVPLDAGSE